MKTASCLIVFVLFLLTVGNGCIPSSPPGPAEEPAAVPAPPAPSPPPLPKTEEVVPPKAERTDPIPATPHDSNEKSHLQVPLDTSKMPDGAIALPIITLVPLEKEKGYRLQSRFPIEGLTMEGTLTLQEPGKWLLSGQFRSDRASFSPSEPTAQGMGAMSQKEGGGLAVSETAGEVMITFSAPLPPAEEPRLTEPKVIPFTLALDAPLNTAFSIMLLPF